MINIAEILKKCPKGAKLYSSVCGDVYFEETSENTIVLKTNQGKSIIFNAYGRYFTDANNYQDGGECLLFPSKDNRDWNTFNTPCPFKPFDKVVVRDGGPWDIDFFKCYDPVKKFPYCCMVSNWKHCFLFNEETAKLIGTMVEYYG